MNTLQKQTSNIIISGKDRAKQIYGVCAMLAPQFYKNKLDEDIFSEIKAIELMTSHIEDEVLSLMCQRAIRCYPLARSENGRQHFDINYILGFYQECFNELYYIMPAGVAISQGYDYNTDTGISTIVWKLEDGGEHITKWVSRINRN